MQVAVGEDDEAAVLRLGVFARLLLADERAFILRFRFQDDERKTLFVEQKEIDKAFRGFLEIVTEAVEISFIQGHARLQLNVDGTILVREKTPARSFQEPVYLNARSGFLHRDGGR